MNLSKWCRRNNVVILGILEQFHECNSVSWYYDFAVKLGSNTLLMVYDGIVLSVPCDCCQELFMKGGRFINA